MERRSGKDYKQIQTDKMITIQIDKKDKERVFKKLALISPEERNSVFKNAFQMVGVKGEEILQEITAGEVLKRRTGDLSRGMQSKITGEGNNLVLHIGNRVRTGERVPYADIHEKGGTVKPRHGKYLTVPLPPALTARGVLRKPARSWDNTFVFKSKAGNLIIGQKRGKRGKVISLFVLKKRVDIPARGYMTKGAKRLTPLAIDILVESIEKGITQ